MYGRAERVINALPQTPTQLSRGVLGVLLGSTVAVILGSLIYLLDAPVWFTGILGTLALMSIGVAIAAPLWFWVYQPFVRGNSDTAEDR